MAEFETEGKMTRTQVATFLREFADELDHEGRHRDRNEYVDADDVDEDRRTRRETEAPHRVTIVVGDESATMTVPEVLEFDVDVESRNPMFSSSVTQEIEFELAWQIEDPEEYTDDTIEVK